MAPDIDGNYTERNGIRIEVDGEIDRVMQCDCSIRRKTGYLLWSV